jgi:hypothetical protein
MSLRVGYYNTKKSWVFTVIFLLLIMPLNVSADRSDATETTKIIDAEDHDTEGIYSSNGKVVEVWIEEIEGLNGSSAHSIDIYIVTFDGLMDHFCGENMFAEDDFTALYTKESLSPSSLPFHFTYNVISDDSLYLLIDNCDNQKDTDYAGNQDTIKVTFAIDDETDELGEAIGDAAAGVGIMMLLGVGVCCVLPFIILIVVILKKKKPDVVTIQSQPPMMQQQQPPMMQQQQPPMMQQQQPPMMQQQQPPMAAPAANPEAMAYYQGLIGQGHDAASAQSYTQQHFPGFQL